jgi:hypothetical protein
MAGAGYKLFNTGDVLTAAQVNTYLQEQVVMVFANAAARTTALASVLAEGMVSYLKDTNATEVYDGSAWVAIGNSGDITGVTAGTGISGGGTSGTVTITNSMATEITAAGDIIVGTGSGTFDNLPIGTTGQVLTADTTVSPYKVKWASASSSPTFVGCRVTHSGNQTAANATNKILDWDTETFDSDGFHSTSSNTSRLTIPSGKAGKYLLFASISFDGNNTGTRYIEMQKNGSTFTQGAFYYTFAAANGGYNGAVYINIVDAAVSDYFQLAVWQNSGGNLTMFTQSGASWFCLTYLGA